MTEGAGRRAALLLLDVQNDVVDARGAFAPTEAQRGAVDDAVASCGRLLAWARATRTCVAHVAVRYRPGHPELDREIGLFGAVAGASALVEGEWGAEFVPAVAPAPGELIVAKRGVDAYAGNDLAIVLRRAGIRDVYLAGISTNLVVLGTAFTSIDQGFLPTIVTDACASATSQDAHDWALELSRPIARQVLAASLAG